MAKRLQHRGGTTSQHSTFTGAVREVTVDTDKNTLVVHDGATAGGHPLATATNFTSTGIDDNATSTAITITSNEDVGIGTTNIDNESAYSSLRIGTAGSIWGYKSSGNSNLFISENISKQGGTRIRADFATSYRQGDGIHTWYNAPSDSAGSAVTLSELMRIDNSGNVLVGKTSTTYSDDGLQLNPEGLIGASDTDSISAIFNRNGTDGSIVSFRKDGIGVGTIGISASNNIALGSTSGNHGGITFGTNTVAPMNVSNFTNADNVYNLGNTSARWKDLYLGGGIFFGGFGTANKLDDYEEGTWTPIYTVSSGTDYPSITYDAFTGGKYTKIGRLVSIQATVRTDAVDSTGVTGSIQIGGLPFTAAGNTTASQRDGICAVSLTDQADWSSGNTPNTGTLGGTKITIGQLYSSSSTTTSILATNLQTGGNKNRVNIQAVYMTA